MQTLEICQNILNLSFSSKGGLDILTALLTESEGIEDEQDGLEQEDDLDGLFDGDEEEEYEDSAKEEGPKVEREDALSDLFGDVDDIKTEEEAVETKRNAGGGEACENLDMSREELQGLGVYILAA